jgi:hypothetical protein
MLQAAGIESLSRPPVKAKRRAAVRRNDNIKMKKKKDCGDESICYKDITGVSWKG